MNLVVENGQVTGVMEVKRNLDDQAVEENPLLEKHC